MKTLKSGMLDISKCQYCFLDYEECTCCKYCRFPMGTCECHLEGEYPCTKLHPSDVYKAFFINPRMCFWFGKETIEDIDKAVMNAYNANVWPERLKK
jgi:hypothetical protein